MGSKTVRIIRAALIMGFLLSANIGHAQMTMHGFAAMGNSVRDLCAGTSVEPKTTSEMAPMIHTSVGNWAFMFRGSGFIVDTQQSGPRGGDKLCSTDSFIPIVS